MPSEHERAPRLATRGQQGGCSMSIRSYKDLDVWQRGVELAAIVDELSEKLVRGRRFAMANQICRAALSVPSNIAEVNGRVHRLEYAHHVSIARGSLLEVESVLYVAIRCKHLGEQRMRQGIHADHGHREHADEAAPRALPRLLELMVSPVGIRESAGFQLPARRSARGRRGRRLPAESRCPDLPTEPVRQLDEERVVGM